jgi:capsular polysaccharide biosynthesis protein
MATASRASLHRFRKRVAGAIEHLWPSRALEAETTLLHAAERLRCPPAETPLDLPPLTRAIYDTWSREPEIESVRRIDRPATIDPEMGIAFIDGRILWGSSDMPPRERAARFIQHLRPPERRLPRAVLLHHVFGGNYFHFFCYVASKADVADRCNVDAAIPLLVPEHTAETRFFREAVARGLFGSREIVVQGRREIIGVDEAWLIRNFDCDYPVFERMAARLLRGIAPQGDDRPLMLVRGKSAPNARHFRNQQAMNALAQARGIEIFDPGEHALETQIARFSSASAIIGAHGAGLTNMMFRRGKPCSVLEIFNPDLGTPHYYIMARQRGFDYRWLMAKDPIGKNNVATTEVPLAEFEAALDALMASLPA